MRLPLPAQRGELEPTSLKTDPGGTGLDGRPHLLPRRAARILLARPDYLTAGQHKKLAELTGACAAMRG
jgi:hypothetical protein